MTHKYQTALVWFRKDLRVADNESLWRACRDSQRVVPVYCIDPRDFAHTDYGFPRTSNLRTRFLLQSLEDLRENLRKRGGELVIEIGRPESVLSQMAERFAVDALYFHEEIASEERRVERGVLKALGSQVTVHAFQGNYLFHPEDAPFTRFDVPEIFSNFRRLLEKQARVRQPLPTPRHISTPSINSGSLPTLEDLGLGEPKSEPRKVLAFHGGETAAAHQVKNYIWEEDRLKNYKQTRNGLFGPYSSKFSPWLSLGCISAREIYHQVQTYESRRIKNKSTYWMVFELIWRDYFRYAFQRWGNAYFKEEGIQGRAPQRRDDPARIKAWCLGETGVPFIDANMKELLLTGFMSNRGRQNVASFLVKDLKQSWLAGAAWFENRLLDYDVHSNWGNWAYVAGVGNDPRAGRYFNILKQAWTYDRRGDYIRIWLPELKHLDADVIHTPHQVPELLPEEAVRYRNPIVTLDQKFTAPV